MTRELISSRMSWERAVGYSRAVRVDDRVWVSGTAPVRDDGDVDADVGDQARRCFAIIGAALSEAGSSFADVVRSRIFIVDADEFPAVAAVHGEVFADIRPACTGVVVAALLDPRWRVEIEVEAVVGSGVASSRP